MAAPNATKEKLFQASLDYINDTIEVLLIDDSVEYSFDPDTDEFVSQILSSGTGTAVEMSGTGYSRQALTTKATSVDATNDEAAWDADDTIFSSIDAGTIQAIVVYEVGPTDDTDSPVLAVFTDDTSGTQVSDLPKATNGGDMTIQWSSEGIKKIS